MFDKHRLGHTVPEAAGLVRTVPVRRGVRALVH